ncbi:cutinase-domain-containing protein [Cercophora newfieldiana]|uniref:cutinase n=1 Tax=Cercophora newfieldiana TaxID=92897 RepID=A0AA39XU06_9PEZI|nr:cutinase-domain-containing protein [Cercophora newfieldiana]
MKFLATFAALAGVGSALPALSEQQIQEIRSRQSSDTRNELSSGTGACPPIIFIHARGSTESGNMGSLGPIIADVLEAHFGANNVWVQGVGGAYKAALLDNFLTDGTTTAAIQEMKNLLTLANTKCPSSKVLAAGYSQGGALAGAAIRDSSAAVREQIKGVTLFGWTKQKQWNNQIPNFPAARLKTFCESGDQICNGSLVVLPAHLEYGDEGAEEGPEFLIARVNAS